MDDQEQSGDNILEPIGRAAVEAAQGVGAELGAIFGGGEAEGPGAAIGRAAADIFDSPRDPASDAEGGIGESLESVARHAMGYGIQGGGDAGGGESGGGGSSDPWDPTPPAPGPAPEYEIPPELESIINPEVDPNDPYRIN